GGEESDEDEPVAQLAQLLERERVWVPVPAERRRVVERQRQMRVRLAHRTGERDRGLARSAREFAPDEVHTGVGVRPPPPDGLLEAPSYRSERIRTRDDDEVRVETVPRIYGGAILAQRLLQAHHGLAGDVPAALRELPVLQVDAGHAWVDVLLDGPDRGADVPVRGG